MFFEIGALKNFAIFTGKHLCWSLLIKLQAESLAERLQHRCFHVNIAKFFTEHLHWQVLLFLKNRKFPSKTSVSEA